MAGFSSALLSSLCLILLSTSVFVSTGVEEEDDVFQLPLHMPARGTRPPKYNDYRCRALELPTTDNYIVSYEPKADPNVAHHMLVYGCHTLAPELHNSSTWNCKSSTICGYGDHPRIIYAWALNASGFQLPPGVGQEVGPGNNMNYIVIQIHYGPLGDPTPAEIPDPTALVLHMTSHSQERMSGVYLLGSSSTIEAGKKEVIIDTACQFRGGETIIPIAFRTHAHAHSTLIVGYVGNGKDQWTPIGYRSPQDPQAFYPVLNNSITVNNGDWLAARCVYNTSSSSNSIAMGPDTEDEMCNFYIMYHKANNGHTLSEKTCWNRAPSGISFPPLPILPPSQSSHHHHHHHSTMGGEEEDGDTPIDIIQPITSSDKQTTSSSDKEKDNYACPSPIPPGPVPSHCRDTIPTNQSYVGVASYQIFPASEWPYNDVDSPVIGSELGALGQVTSVAMGTDGNVFVLHRGPRVWDASSFTRNNLFTGASEGHISTPVLLKFSGKGELRGVWGGGHFYLPHGLTVDQSGGIWITDVASHQVFKFNSYGEHKPALILGHKLIPGTTSGFFCKPADVVVATSGTFYVADGYCNSRVMVYQADGKLKNILGDHAIDGKPLNVPHSLALSPAEDELFVADRENKRIVVLGVVGGGQARVLHTKGLDRVFAVGFGRLGSEGWPLLSVMEDSDGTKGVGVAINKDDDIEEIWGINKFNSVHDLAVDVTGRSVYVCELTPPRIWKFSISSVGMSGSTPPQLPSTTTGSPQQPSSSGSMSPTSHPVSSSSSDQPPPTPSTSDRTTTSTTANQTAPPSTKSPEPSQSLTGGSPSSSSSSPPPPAIGNSSSPTPGVPSEGSSSGQLNPTSDDPIHHNSNSTSSGDNSAVEMTMTGKNSQDQASKSSSGNKKVVSTPVYHYGLFAAIFAIVGLILVVVIGILKEHRLFRFRGRRGVNRGRGGDENKSSRETLHSLLGPSKLGFSRLRTYDSDSEAEEFPIFSRQL